PLHLCAHAADRRMGSRLHSMSIVTAEELVSFVREGPIKDGSTGWPKRWDPGHGLSHRAGGQQARADARGDDPELVRGAGDGHVELAAVLIRLWPRARRGIREDDVVELEALDALDVSDIHARLEREVALQHQAHGGH